MNNIYKTEVISAFPGTGKTYCVNNIKNRFYLDSDSSQFSWISSGVRDPNFPQNYINHIRSNIGKCDAIFVSSHEIVRKSLRDNGIEYILIYPNKSLLDEYLKRYRNRGSQDSFISLLENNWDLWIDSCENDPTTNKIVLDREETIYNLYKSYINE